MTDNSISEQKPSEQTHEQKRLSALENSVAYLSKKSEELDGGWSAGFRITGTPDQQKALFAALAKAQGAFAPIVKDKKVDVIKEGRKLYEFYYADLDAVLDATRPALNANGLFLATPYSGSRTEVVRVLISHCDGGTIETLSVLPGPFLNKYDQPDEQARGSAITYRRRYMVTTLLGIASENDDDGNASMGQQAVPKPAPKSA
jgi:hypothetical protein